MDSVEELKRAYEVSRMSYVSALTNQGKVAFESNDPARALQSLREAYKIFPENDAIRRNYASVLTTQGTNLYLSGAQEEGMSLIEEHIKAFPEDDSGYRIYATALFANDAYRAAEMATKAWEHANTEENFNLVRNIVGGLGGPLDRAFNDEPERYVAKLARGRNHLSVLAYARSLPGESFDEAMACLDEAIAMRPDLPFAYLLRASMYGDTGAVSDAWRDFQAVQSLAPMASREAMIRMDLPFFDSLRERPFQFRRPIFWRSGAHRDDVDYVIFCGCDIKYFRKYSESFLRSVREKCRGRYVVHMLITNPDDEFFREDVPRAENFLNGRINFTWDAVDPAEIRDQLPSYYACVRLLNLPDILRFYERPVVFSDVDLLFSKDVGEVVSSLGEEDLLVPINKYANPAVNYSIDFMVMGYRGRIVEYFDLVARYMDLLWSEGKARWYTDQTCMYCVQSAAAPDGPFLKIEDMTGRNFMEYVIQIKGSTENKFFRYKE